MIRVWKFAYDRWHDHMKARHRIRAAFWGFITDQVSIWV